MKQTRRAALPNTLRQRNYLAILNAFRGEKPLSANDVSEKTGISRATVMKAVNNFIEKGLLESAGKGSSTEIGGKRPELFQFCMKRYLICIGLWSDEMVASLYDLTNTLIARKTRTYNMKENVGEFLDMVQGISDDLLSEIENGRELLYGLSLCIGGFLDDETGILQYSVLTPEWGENVPLRELLAERFPQAEIVVDNVARMSACAAVLDNPDYEQKRVAVVYTDVGVSACYIDKGHVEHGKHSLIGEIGLMAVSLSETEPYTSGQQSFFSTQVSEKTLCGKALEDPERLKRSSLYQYRDDMKLEHIFRAADAGDELAREIIRHAAWLFSAMLHNIVVNFDPETVIIQGSYAQAGSWFDQCLREGNECFRKTTSASMFDLRYDSRALISLQMMGMTKVLARKFFSSTEWI